MRFAWCALLFVTVAAPAAAHVAPSQTGNNRYIKVLPFADRVRVAYTVFYGEAPGRAMRAALDTDHDGQISDAEARAYGDKLAAEVAPAMEVVVDGVRQHLRFDEVSVGLGSPSVTAGAWSVDLVAWPCSAAGADGVHHVVLRDRYDLPLAAETELWVVDVPDVAVVHAWVGGMRDASHDYQWSGPSQELAVDGLDLAYTAGPRAGTGSAGACGAPRARGGSHTVTIAAAIGGAVLGLLAMLVARRRRKPASADAR
jgi:hypothetical protein